jgi:hypothetical protein
MFLRKLLFPPFRSNFVQVTHSLSVIFFSRTFISRPKSKRESDNMYSTLPTGIVDVDGRLYEVRRPYFCPSLRFSLQSLDPFKIANLFLLFNK